MKFERRMVVIITIETRDEESYNIVADQIADEIRNAVDLVVESAIEKEEGESSLVDQIGHFGAVVAISDEQ